MVCELNKPLLAYNTFGVEARADAFISYTSEDDLREALAVCRRRFPHLPLLHIGGGSNLLFLADYHGVVLYSCIRGVELLGEEGGDVLVRVGSGVTHDDWVALAVAEGWHGMENLSLIPGQVGASAVQNIGAYGVEAADVIHSVRGVSLQTGEAREWTNAECRYAYRSSVFKGALRGQYAITYVTFRLSRTFSPRLDYGGLRATLDASGTAPGSCTAAQLRDIIIGVRRAKLPDPAVTGNAGSFFMNPVVDADTFGRLRSEYPSMPYYDAGPGLYKVPAGWLIEKCGWKGRQLGRAAVHSRQALVLVNGGGATGHDILALCEAVRADVRATFGIDLRPEVNIIGN